MGIINSCEKNYVPPKTDAGNNTFGFYEMTNLNSTCCTDTFEVGGKFDANDTVSVLTDSSFRFKLITRSLAHMFKSYRWRCLEFEIHYKELGPNHHSFELDTLSYANFTTWTEEDTYPDNLDEHDAIYVTDTSLQTYFHIVHHNMDQKYIAGEFDLNLAYLVRNNDTSYVDPSSVIRLESGRFDLRY